MTCYTMPELLLTAYFDVSLNLRMKSVFKSGNQTENNSSIGHIQNFHKVIIIHQSVSGQVVSEWLECTNLSCPIVF